MMPGTGPYEIDITQTSQEDNGMIVLKKRADYWAANDPRNIGLNNFDYIRFLFINDENQQIERFFQENRLIQFPNAQNPEGLDQNFTRQKTEKPRHLGVFSRQNRVFSRHKQMSSPSG